MILTLGKVRPGISRAIGVAESSSEVPHYVNQAQERLIQKGRWVGTVQRYRVCVDDACLTWPRQIEAIEAFAVCQTPGIIRDQWFEYVADGYGIRDEDDSDGRTLLDRGDGFVTFKDVNHSASQPKKIKVTAEVSEDSTSTVIVMGYDENSKWIRTVQSGSQADGESLSLATGAATSTNYFSAVTNVIKSSTNGIVRLFEFDPSTGITVQLAHYEWDETHPNYRRSFVPNLQNLGACCDTDTDCDNKSVTVLAKLRHMPVTRDNDRLILRKESALKLMVMAIIKEEKNLFGEARAYEAQAVALLQEELSSYIGAGTVQTPRMQSRELWGGGGVANYVGS